MSQVVFHPNGRYFAASTGSTFWYTPIDIIIWDMYTGTQRLKITTYEDEEVIVAIESIHFDQTGNVLFVKDSKQLISVYDTKNGDLLETVQISDEENVAELFSKYPLGSSFLLREAIILSNYGTRMAYCTPVYQYQRIVIAGQSAGPEPACERYNVKFLCNREWRNHFPTRLAKYDHLGQRYLARWALGACRSPPGRQKHICSMH